MIKKNQGFTLIEVLAAFMVFSLVFATVIQLTTSSIKNIVIAENYTQAALWAESKFAEVRNRKELDEGIEQGKFNDLIRWKLRISPYDSNWPLDDSMESSSNSQALPPFDLIRVELQIFWNDNKRQLTYTSLLSRKIQKNK